MLKDKERSFLWPFTLICFCWLSPCFVVALPNLNPVSPRLHHEPRSTSTVLRALANLKKVVPFPPHPLVKTQEFVSLHWNFTMGWLSTGLSSILPLGHGHSRPSVEEVFTKVSRQMSLEHQPPVDGKWLMGSDPKTHKNIKKHLCGSIYKASKNRM